ncbi:RHS repeat domain-containing protein [Kineococcus sp. SYSU DK002]|uniref:RHS repeat domain-containing protein n=1 Tax=Kineococcus sp. SYSU DK002 TaxID=3383123 RepID=UPI003D7D5CCE
MAPRWGWLATVTDAAGSRVAAYPARGRLVLVITPPQQEPHVRRALSVHTL